MKIKVYTCPACKGHEIHVRFPVWITAREALNDDTAPDADQLVEEVGHSLDSCSTPILWLCDCGAEGPGEPSEITEIEDGE